MSTSTAQSARIRENILQDPRYPVHRIADQLRPYLQILVDQFQPEQVILFGSYAHGHPSRDSDVDLLVVKELNASPISEATAIRRAFRPIRHSETNLAFDILVRDQDDLRSRMAQGADFHEEIMRSGLRLV